MYKSFPRLPFKKLERNGSDRAVGERSGRQLGRFLCGVGAPCCDAACAREICACRIVGPCDGVGTVTRNQRFAVGSDDRDALAVRADDRARRAPAALVCVAGDARARTDPPHRRGGAGDERADPDLFPPCRRAPRFPNCLRTNNCNSIHRCLHHTQLRQ